MTCRQIACALVLAAASPARTDTAISGGDAAFAAALHSKLGSQPGNLFYSPASVRLALGMAYAGARADTAAEMQKALALPAGDAAHLAFAKLLADWDRL